MPFLRQAPKPVRPVIRTDMATIVAAASPIGLDRKTVEATRLQEEAWAKEAWRHLDICGELRFVANRRGSQLSTVRLYVAEVDENGAVGKQTSEGDVAALGEAIFGGPAARAEAIRLMGVHLFVGGESYIVAEAGTGKTADGEKTDRWYVLSADGLKRDAGRILAKRPPQYGGDWYQLRDKQDLLIRAWTPHPKKYEQPDSPTRSVLPVLREIERLSMLTMSQIDSRLISAGIMLIRQGFDFPRAEGKAGGVQGLMEMILEIAKAQLSGAGTAGGLVPIALEVPGDDVSSAIHHMTFETPVQQEIREKIDHAIRRLALGLDCPPEVLLGQGAANHWSAWQISEDEIKTQVEPVVIRLCDALTEAYLRPALQAMGKDPAKYTLWYDTSPLAVRPNRLEDALKLHALGIVGPGAVADAGAFDTPATKAEVLQWRVWELVKLNPQLAGEPAVQEILGLPAIGGGQPEQPPEDQQEPQGGEQPGLPAMPDGRETPAQSGEDGFAGLVAASEQTVFRALELAGKRLLVRKYRGQLGDVPGHEIHLRVPVADRAHADQLLSGAFAHVPDLADHFGVPAADLHWLLHGYCTELLVRSQRHGAPLLRDTLRFALQGGRRATQVG